MARAACKFIVHFSMSFCTTRPTRPSFRKNGTLLSCRPYRCWACAIAQQLDESNRRTSHLLCQNTMIHGHNRLRVPVGTVSVPFSVFIGGQNGFADLWNPLTVLPY